MIRNVNIAYPKPAFWEIQLLMPIIIHIDKIINIIENRTENILVIYTDCLYVVTLLFITTISVKYLINGTYYYSVLEFMMQKQS